MAPSKAPNAQARLDYLLLLISKAEFKPDFHATAAAAAKTSSANNAHATMFPSYWKMLMFVQTEEIQEDCRARRQIQA